jgi:putative redox protein
MTMTHSITSKYLGGLRTESIHLKSQSKIITDAPLDNNGKGEAFSPTDLLSTSLATCMFTIMGIVSNKNGLNIDGTNSRVTKIMSAIPPRKVVEIIIEFDFPKNNFDENQKEILRQAAYSCPVALSLSDDLKKTVIFNF